MSFAIPPKVYKKSEAVVRLVRGEGELRGEAEQHQNKELDKLEARRGGTQSQGKQLSNIYSIDVGMILNVSVNK